MLCKRSTLGLLASGLVATTALVAVAATISHSTASDFAAGQFSNTRDGGSGPTAPSLTLTRGGDFGDGRDGSVIITSVKDLNANTIASGRTIADGVAYKINTIGSSGGVNTITLDADPTGGIAVGDRVLIINLQGNAGAHGNVGNWETATVSTAAGSTLTLNKLLANVYGGSTNSDLTNQKVVCQRVPQYADVTIQSGGQITASGWNGLSGTTGSGRYRTGIAAFYANGTLTVNAGGKITVDGKGYRGGDIPADHRGGDGGESITGMGGLGATCACWSGPGGGGGGGNASGNNGGNGAFGGGGAVARNSTGTPGTGSQTGGGGGGGSVRESWSGGGGGYGTPGLGNAVDIGGPSNNGGENVSGNGYVKADRNYTVGGGGGTYGMPELTRIFFGSGGGGGGIYEYYGHPEWAGMSHGVGGYGGGIIMVWAATLTNNGSITSAGTNSANDTNSNNSSGGGGAGGSILLTCGTSTLGSSGVTAYGGHSTRLTTDYGETGGRGRIRVVQGDGTLAGSSVPSYSLGTIAFNSSGTYTSAALPTTDAALYGTISWTATVPGGSSLAFNTRSSSDGTNWSAWSNDITSSGSAIPSTPAAFLQYRATFSGSSTQAPAVTSVTLSYTTNAPPTAFSLTSPADLFSTTNNRPGFTWGSSTDPEGQPITYTLHLANDAGFSSIYRSVSALTTAGYNPLIGQELANGTYYWKVTASDGATQTDSSQTRRITINASAPSQPELIGMWSDLKAGKIVRLIGSADAAAGQVLTLKRKNPSTGLYETVGGAYAWDGNTFTFDPTIPIDIGSSLYAITGDGGANTYQSDIGVLSFEYARSVFQDNAVYHGAGGSSMRLEKSTAYEFKIAANASTQITVSCWVRKNAGYSGTSPKITLSGAGVSSTSASMSAGADTWQQLTVSGTPSAAGVLTLRFDTFSTAAGAAAWIDDISVSQ